MHLFQRTLFSFQCLDLWATLRWIPSSLCGGLFWTSSFMQLFFQLSVVQLATPFLSFLLWFFCGHFHFLCLSWCCLQLDTMYWANVVGVVHVNNSAVHRLGDLFCYLQIWPGYFFLSSGFISLEGGMMDQIMDYDMRWLFTPGGCGLNHCLAWPWSL